MTARQHDSTTARQWRKRQETTSNHPSPVRKEDRAERSGKRERWRRVDKQTGRSTRASDCRQRQRACTRTHQSESERTRAKAETRTCLGAESPTRSVARRNGTYQRQIALSSEQLPVRNAAWLPRVRFSGCRREVLCRSGQSAMMLRGA
jgi:hypothetical protein